MKGTVEQRAPLPVDQVCQCYQLLAASVRSSLIDSVSSPAARSSMRPRQLLGKRIDRPQKAISHHSPVRTNGAILGTPP